MQYDAIIKVKWCTTFDAENEKQFIQMCKDQWLECYGIRLTETEIEILKEN